MVHAMAGILPAAQHHWDCYVENLAFTAAQARTRGITVIVEAMSQAAVPDYFLATPDDAARAIAAAATIDFDQVELALRNAGYDGFLGCEYSPVGSTEAGLGWLRYRRIAAA